MQKVEYFDCEYHEIEELVHKHLGLNDYELPCDLESGNDTSHRFHVDGKLDEWDIKNLKQTLLTKKSGTFNTRLFLQELCRRGHIEPGKYLVRVCW